VAVGLSETAKPCSPTLVGTGRRLARVLIAALAASVFLGVPSAQASTVQVGQLFFPDTACPGTATLLQRSVSVGPSYTVPSPGLITSWSFETGATTLTGLKLKVARPVGPVSPSQSDTIVAESTAGAQTVRSVNTYPASILVQAGDIIGIYASGTANCQTVNGITLEDIFGQLGADEPPGSTNAYINDTGRVPVSASLQPTPGIVLISPASGSVSGGASVTIAGQDFTGTTAVSFGSLPAKSFTVNSDNLLTAISPPTATPGPVDLRVTSNAGTSPVVPAGRFTYTQPASTGERAAALANCKKRAQKHNWSKKRLKKCKKKARLLPI
jgi:hypothetical protein